MLAPPIMQYWDVAVVINIITAFFVLLPRLWRFLTNVILSPVVTTHTFFLFSLSLTHPGRARSCQHHCAPMRPRPYPRTLA
jgi:hypothetical protein